MNMSTGFVCGHIHHHMHTDIQTESQYRLFSAHYNSSINKKLLEDC